eukprot:m.3281 g.3281  ORF g.3281 m.3281 type:complete len:82 (+) comp2672_c0_seq1:88-333(+)
MPNNQHMAAHRIFKNIDHHQACHWPLALHVSDSCRSIADTMYKIEKVPHQYELTDCGSVVPTENIDTSAMVKECPVFSATS